MHVAKGGVYILSDGERSVMVRAWTNAAAPPSANTGILMVSDQNVTRGALGDNLELGVLSLGVAAAIAIPLALADDAS